MNDNIKEGLQLGNIIIQGSLASRIIGVYLWVYLFVTFVSLFIVENSNIFVYTKTLKSFLPGFIHPSLFIASIPALLFIIFFEYLRYRYSKKHNLPRWKDATLVLAEREFEKQKLDETNYMKKQARINDEINKNSLGYWFDLKEKGAITSEEYEKKKLELL